MRRIFLSAACAASSLLWGASSIAAGEAINVTITSISTASNFGDVLFVRTSAAPTFTPPGCATNATWNFVLSLDNSQWANKTMALIVMAKAQGTIVTISGLGSCGPSPANNVELLRAITLYE